MLWNETGLRAEDDAFLDVRCLVVGTRAAAAIAAFLREHGGASMRARAGATIPPPGAEKIDLIVVPRFPHALLP